MIQKTLVVHLLAALKISFLLLYANLTIPNFFITLSNVSYPISDILEYPKTLFDPFIR